jgi:mannose-1-phosphate guanylyltransferase
MAELHLRDKLYAVIMAGGRGERFWPLSTYRRPKPFVEGLFARSLFRMTVERVLRGLPPGRVWVVVGSDHRTMVQAQAPEVPSSQVLLEPMARDTAAAIAYAALVLERTYGPDVFMLVLPCDHWIQPADGFWATVDVGLEVLADEPDREVVFGVLPTRPETAYGYIQVGDPLRPDVYQVRAFHEKPDAATAQRYLVQGDFYWNAGIFLWRVGRILELLERHLPETYAVLRACVRRWGHPGFPYALETAYEQIRPISIDYGVMEKADGIVMVTARFLWDDVGQWEALERLPVETDGESNRVWGPATLVDARNCIVVNTSGWVAVVGLEDVVVVHDRGRILVMKKGRGAHLKSLVRQLPPETVEV